MHELQKPLSGQYTTQQPQGKAGKAYAPGQNLWGSGPDKHGDKLTLPTKPADSGPERRETGSPQNLGDSDQTK